MNNIEVTIRLTRKELRALELIAYFYRVDIDGMAKDMDCDHSEISVLGYDEEDSYDAYLLSKKLESPYEVSNG